MPDLQLSQLIEVQSPEAVWQEVQAILDLALPDFASEPVRAAFDTAVSLYQGRYPGYQACNTPYHDLAHITDVFLAMARLIHGAVLDGWVCDGRYLTIGLIATLFHDSGLIQKENDREGTGAKYLSDHDRRSMDILAMVGKERGWHEEEIGIGRFLIGCTDLRNDVAAIAHPVAEVTHLGQLLAAADLIAQMADRVYLEKLLYLYHEFKEGHIGDYSSEIDLLEKTVGFFAFVEQRLASIHPMIDRYARLHFAARWQADANLYHEAMMRHKLYLQKILSNGGDPRDQLRRQDVVRQVRALYGAG